MTVQRSIFRRFSAVGGDQVMDAQGEGESYGTSEDFHFPPLASVAAGQALTDVAGLVYIPFYHRLKGCVAGASVVTAVAPATDPAVDFRRHHPVPAAPTVALKSPAAAGLTTNGTRGIAVTFTTAAGNSMPSLPVYVTVVDKDVNGKLTIDLPIGPASTTGRKVWSTEAGGTQLKLAYTVANNTATEQEYNLADASLGANIHVASTAAATVLASTLKLSAVDRSLAYQPLEAALADLVEATIWPPCSYDMRILTGAATGAITNLLAHLRVERVAL